MTGPTIADLIRRESRAGLRGRARELSLLDTMLREDGPAVAYVHGPSGIGKTALLRAFEATLDERGTTRLRVEAGAVEPRPEAILASLAAELGLGTGDLPAFASAVASRAQPLFLTIDDVDTWRLAASWLRLELVPRLPATMRVVLAGTAAPPREWSDYGRLFLDLRLGPLARADVDALVAAEGFDPAAAERIWGVSAGHPLGVRLALHAARSGALATARDAGEVANEILHAIGDADLRRATEACAIVRRASRPLVSAILGAAEPVGADLMERVEALPFADRDAEGLFIAEPVRLTIVDWMAGLEAERHALWRRRAADWITARLRTAPPRDRWRHMADLLHLLDQPALRNAFFPPDGPAVPVEPARPADHAAILRLTEARHGADERQRIGLWLARVPHRFNVVRSAEGEAVAYYLHARPDDPLDGLAEADPLFAAWLQHLVAHPASGEVLYVRQMLAHAPGAPERLACNLDLKRNYIERWGLARIYTCAMEEALAGPLLHNLGFRPLFPPRDGVPGSMMLDLPGADLIGWVSSLVGAADPPRAASGLEFARDRREVRVGDHAATLTRLEASVLAALIDAAPDVVGREVLIETVWRRAFVGSNVVDTVIRTLRKKLGPMRDCIQTVPKAGYRYVAPPQQASPAGAGRSLGAFNG